MALVSIARDIYVALNTTVASAPVSLAGANGVHLAVTAISFLGSVSADKVTVIPQVSVDGVSWRGFGPGSALDAAIMDLSPGAAAGGTQWGLGTAQETIAANATIPRISPTATEFRVALGAVYFRVLLKSSSTGGGVFSVDVNTFVA